MNASIARRELRYCLKRVLFWCLGLALISGACAVTGHYDSGYPLIMLLAGLQALLLGTDTLGREESGGTADFMFSRPVERRSVLTVKLVAALLGAAVVCAVTWVVYASLMPLGGEEINIPSIMARMLALQWFFAALGFAVSAASPFTWYRKPVVAAYFVFFALGLTARVFGIAALNALTPFGWLEVFDSAGTFPWAGIVVSLILTAGLSTLSYFQFPDRDIRSL